MPRNVHLDATVVSPGSRSIGPFRFPADQHLIITTSGGIFSWDSKGVGKVFNSSKKGILAAREAKDGSQLLAVADKHVVVLHDCKRGREESWGLNGTEGRVRLLEYAPDAKSLFLSTTLTGAIQRYSINESRLLDPPTNHPSPPTIIAVSPASHLMISASENPPVVYLQNLTLSTPAIQLHPSASNQSVAAASFHPERPNIFLLAFNDGTLAAYDATKMTRRSGVRVDGHTCTSTDGRAGEIASFKKLHRITNIKNISDPPDASPNTAIGSKSMAITSAAFLPGYRTRAVSVGADGRCRIVDFEAGGKIVRTWHAQAPVTSLSVLAIKEKAAAKAAEKKKMEQKQRSSVVGGPTGTNSILAIGRIDGQVLLFDSLGLKLDQIVANELGEKIISVEWMKGPSPAALLEQNASTLQTKDLYGLASPAVPWIGKESTSRLSTALEPPLAAVFPPQPTAPVAPIAISVADELSTVRYTPGAAALSPAPMPETSYLDLFSPVKQVKSPPPQQLRRSPDSSPRALSRPRLSSQTFVRTSSPEPTPKKHKHKGTPKTPKQLSIHPLNTTIASDQTPSVRATPPISARRRSPLRSGTKSARKRALRRVTPTISGTHSTMPAAATRNGQVLADLRKLGAAGTSHGKEKRSNLAMFAPYMNRTSISNLPRIRGQQPAQNIASITVPLDHQRHLDHTAEHQHNHKHDQHPGERTIIAFDSESHSSDRDIWLSAGSSDGEHMRTAKRKQKRFQERYAKPAHVAHAQPIYVAQGALPPQPSTQILHAPTSYFSPESTKEVTVTVPQPQTKHRKADVLSMSDEAMFSAVSHLSLLDGNFMPASNDVRKLFPRGSSLSSPSSPYRSPRRSPRRLQVWNDGATGNDVDVGEGREEGERAKLGEIQPNAIRRATQRHEEAKKAAWAILGQGASKAKALPALPPHETREATYSELRFGFQEEEPSGEGAEGTEKEESDVKECENKECDGCKGLGTRVRGLEEEVARLKAEVLGLRSALRRTGVSSKTVEAAALQSRQKGIRVGRRKV